MIQNTNIQSFDLKEKEDQQNQFQKKGSSQAETPHGNLFEASKGTKWNEIPIGFFVLLFSTSAVFLVSCIIPVDKLLMNYPVYTLLFLNFWRPFTSFLAVPDAFNLIVTMTALLMMSIYEEKFAGSARYLLEVLYRNLAIQIAFTLIGSLVELIFGLKSRSFGVWPVYMVIITLRCLEFPDKETFLFVMCYPVKNKYYPLIILVMFLPWMIAYGPTIDLWIGFALAHLINQFKVFQNLVEPSADSILKVEKFLLSLGLGFGTIIKDSAAFERKFMNSADNTGKNAGDYFEPQESQMSPQLQQMSNYPQPQPIQTLTHANNNVGGQQRGNYLETSKAKTNPFEDSFEGVPENHNGYPAPPKV